MPFNFAAVKAQARTIVHRTFGIDAEYWLNDGDTPVPLRVRWHSRLTLSGDPTGDGYPLSLDSIDRVIFNMDELAEKGVTISRAGRLKITAEQYGGQVLTIDSLEKKSGPTEEIWHVGILNGEQHS